MSAAALDPSAQAPCAPAAEDTVRHSPWQWTGLASLALAISSLLTCCALLATAVVQKVDQGSPRALRTSGPALPVFMMHGLEAYAASFKHVTRWLQDEQADIRAIPIALYEGEESFDDLNSQVKGVMEYIREEVRRDPGAFAEGYNLLCHSQGALICRAVVQDMDDHNVRTLVAMAGPQLGVFGAPAYWIRHLAGVGELAASNPSGLAYSKMLQDTFSVANMWNDPTMQDRFLRQNLFLPKYNGLTNDAAGNARRRQNLLRLDRAVFLGGSLPGRLGDDVIKPAASSVFGYFRVGSKTDVVPMKNQPFWAQDTLGLRALDKSGRLVVQVVPNARHRDWIWNEMLLRKYVFPHLV